MRALEHKVGLPAYKLKSYRQEVILGLGFEAKRYKEKKEEFQAGGTAWIKILPPSAYTCPALGRWTPCWPT